MLCRPESRDDEAKVTSPPCLPVRTISRSVRAIELYTALSATYRRTPCNGAASIISLASATVIAMGFSTSTRLPAAAASTAIWQCRACGVQIDTASTRWSTSASR